ncbi:MAG: helix-turn-helix domain-containing protein [Pseudonocardiaceae bacterium]
MDEDLAKVVGHRVRFYRTAVRQTRTVTAGLTGVTPDYLYQIERGQKLPTITVLAKLAEVLRVPLAELFPPHPTPRPPRQACAAGDAIYHALTNPRTEIKVATSPADLRRDVVSAWEIWQTSPYRYSLLTNRLPLLVERAEAALRASATHDEKGRRALYGSAADLYCLLRTVTKRTGRNDVSLLVADRAVRAAEAADQPLRIAVARWNLTQVLLADGQAEGAESVAMHAADDLLPLLAADNLDAVALRGSLLLIATIAAARQGQGWIARDRLKDVVPLAALTGERNTGWTAFGPTNVAMYAVSIEMETGEAVEGLRLAPHVDHLTSPSIERRVAFLLDQARGYQQRRDYSSAFLLLTTARREAPEDIEHRPAAHTILRAIIEHGRRPIATEAARLAIRIGLPL